MTRPDLTEWLPGLGVNTDLEALAAVLHAAVHEGASVGFVLPFSLEDALAFWRARVLPAGDARAAFLAVECGPDAELRGRVERLLAAHAELGSVVPEAAAATSARPPSDSDDADTPEIGTLLGGLAFVVADRRS